MAVNLSPIGGVAGQFFDNNGDPLTGGKIYTYAAGTTTPQTTYTSSTGTTPHSNPIVLDAAGRVPSGEIWLTDSFQYKFVIQTSNNVLIGTYDNIIGINSNFVNYSAQTEVQTATAGQTVFTLTTINYAPGTNTLSVFVDGVNQYAGTSYIETNSTTVTFSAGLHVGAEVKFTTTSQLGSGAVDAGSVVYDAPYTNSVATTVETKLSEYVSVKDFGAVGDGVADDTNAIDAAHATGKPVFYPYGTYKHVGVFPSCEGGIIGEGWSTNTSAKTTRIVFYNCTSPGVGAITPKQSSPKSNFFRISNIEIQASSWDLTTGCLGYGLDIGVPVIMENVYIQGFKRSNMFFHHVWPVAGSFVTGPYESRLSNVYSAYSGEHGCLVGYGANVLSFINYQGKWNGATTFGVAPAVAGNYDGFHVAATADGNDITPYNPESITIISGDCSYNSRYGWNFDLFRNSSCVCPGYAEGNLTNEARIGEISYCLIAFGQLANGVAGFTNAQAFSAYFYTNTVYYGGKRVHPVNYYGFISNPSAADEVGGTVQNAPDDIIYISRSNDATKLTYFSQNATPDGTAVNPATETVATLRGFGTYFLGLGDGARHLKIGTNSVRLPDIYAQATTTGWSAPSVLRGMGAAAPTTGAWTQGDIIYNTAPTAGGFIGWVCTASGTPGTWRTFGAIS